MGTGHRHEALPLTSEHLLQDLNVDPHSSTVSTPERLVYGYTPLPDSNSFRLLTIHRDESNAPLTLSLTPVHFSDKLPVYEALSYVWGMEPGCKAAMCNGHFLENITTNLHEALERLRTREEDRIVWIDALCIRQDSEAEKSEQVRRMDRIYREAKQVVVWLGTDKGGIAESAFQVICALADGQNAMSIAGDNEGIQINVPTSYESIKAGKHVTKTGVRPMPPFSNGALWSSVHDFFQNKWFLRMWVLQEIVLARSATVMWGSCSISWDTIGTAIDKIWADPTLHSLLESRGLQNAFFMQHLRALHQPANNNEGKKLEEEVKHPFLHLLDIARSFDVTEPRDKVYGLLGFPTRDANLETGVSIVPNYHLPVTDVYIDAARKVMEQDQNLDVLSFVVHMRHSIGNDIRLPSWVPDWTCKDIAYPFMGFTPENRHDAGSGRAMELIENTDAKTLCLRGVIVDVIQDVGEKVPFSDYHASSAVLKKLVDWCILQSANTETMATTLTAGRDVAGHLISNGDQHVKAFSAVLIALRGVPSLPSDPAGLMILRSDSEQAREAMWRYTCYRSPIWTVNHGLGLGPGGAKVGDKIVVLWGGQVPYVMREVEGKSGVWRFVGEAYVEGLMNGETGRLVDNGNLTERVFEIA
jgi:hypothetical protein